MSNTQTPAHFGSSLRTRHVVQITLLAAALALAGCSSTSGGGGRHAAGGASPDPSIPGDGSGLATVGLLEGALGNTGGSVDNVANLGLENTLGGLGKQLDAPLKPVIGLVESTTQGLGAQTGLGKPLDGTLKQVGGVVSGLGGKLGDTGLPGGLGTGLGALLTGVGDGVSSAGNLLNKSADNPYPLTNTLVSVTGGVRGLTGALTGSGGLLQPLGGILGGKDSGLLGGLLGGKDGAFGQPALQPTLGNTGKAIDQVLPLGLQTPLAGLGKGLDGAVSPVAGVVTQVTRTVGDGLGVGAPVNQLLTSIGGSLQQVGGGADGAALLGLNGVVANLGAAVGSAGGLLHKTPANTNPLGNTLDNATKAVVALTDGLGVGGLLGGGEGAQGGLLGGLLGGGEGAQGGLLGGLLGGGEGAQGGLLGGLLGGGEGAQGGLLGGLLGGGGGAQGGLLGGGLLGGGEGAQGGLLGGLLGGGGEGGQGGGLLGGLLGGLASK